MDDTDELEFDLRILDETECNVNSTADANPNSD